MTVVPGTNCPAGVNRRVFAFGRVHLPAIAGVRVGLAVRGSSAVVNLSSMRAPKLTFVAWLAGVTFVTRSKGFLACWSELAPSRLDDDSDEEVWALA